MTPKPMAFKNKRRAKKPSNKYLKPGALAQIRYNMSSSRCCTDIGKKRVVLDSKDKTNIVKKSMLLDRNDSELSPTVFSAKNKFRSLGGPNNAVKQVKVQDSPRTPSSLDHVCHSRLESLPTDLLVKIICNLHHDQLRAVFHVSQRIRSAATIARQTYFNYTTPDRSRLEMLSIQTPLPADRWHFTRGGGKDIRISSPLTPKAPRPGPRPPRFHLLDIKQVAAVLSLPTSCMLLPHFPKPPVIRPLASNRVLFYEEELCQAVVQNTLR